MKKKIVVLDFVVNAYPLSLMYSSVIKFHYIDIVTASDYRKPTERFVTRM